MKKEVLIRTIGILLIVVFFAGCSTMMTVNAVDPFGMPIENATVMVDNERIGQTPDANTRVSNFIGTSTNIRVMAEGYYPRTTEPEREFKVGSFIGGLIMWPLLLWTYGPRATQTIMLSPQPQ